MGGYGSGRKFSCPKTTVEDCLKVDANMFAYRKGFKPGLFEGTVRWTRGDMERGSCGYYAVLGGDRSSIEFLYNTLRFTVSLSWYRPGYGGRRYFFMCPRCRRRMRTLFFKGNSLACRVCHDLTYESCNQYEPLGGLYGSGISWREEREAWRMMRRMELKRPRGRPRKPRPEDQ